MKVLLWSLAGLLGVSVFVGIAMYIGAPHLFLGANTLFSPQEPGTVIENTKAPSGKQVYSLESEGVRRTFIVYRPEALPSDEAVPVVFMFHGGGGYASGPYRSSGWTEKAKEEGFMVVYPQAMKYHVYSEEKVEQGRVVQDVAEHATRWNTYNLEKKLDPEYPGQKMYDDVAYVRSILSLLQDKYAIDRTHIYASGFSNGGSMVERLMIEATDIFAAFSPSSSGGISPEETTQMLDEYKPETFEPRPTIRLLGSLDPKLTHVSQIEEFVMSEAAAEEDNPVFERYIEGQLAILDLADTYIYETNGELSHFSYTEPKSESDSEASYHLYIINDMKHVYPNGKNYWISAPNLTWSFFAQYGL